MRGDHIMRTIALSIFFLAVVQLNADKVPAFEKGKKYTYAYKSRIATGVGDESHQFSGFGFIANLHIQNDGDSVVFQMKDMKTGAFNTHHDHLMAEMDMSYSRPSGEQSAMVQEMEKPFWVEFDNGVVKSIEFLKNDKTPDYNVKKAVATLFQIDLKKEGKSHPYVYTVNEDGIGGECETMYQIGHNHDMDSPNVEVMNVTKTRHYTKCSYRPHLFHTYLMGHGCGDCSQSNFNPLRSAGIVEYNMKGNRDHFTIEELHSTGTIMLTPFTTNGQTAVSVVNQTLVLVKEQAATPIPKPSDLEKVTSLSYTFNNDHRDIENVDLKAAHYGNKIYDGEYPERMAKVMKWFKELQSALKKHKKETKYVAKLVTAMQKLNYDELVQFCDGNVWNDDKMKTMMPEILPLLGTNPSIVYVMNIIESGKVIATDAFEMIQKVPYYVKEPSYKLLMAMKEFGGKDIVTKNRKLYSASRLAYGTMIFKGCVHHDMVPHPAHSKTYISTDKCSAMVEELIQKFKNSQDKTEHGMYLRAIGNARTENALQFVSEIVKGHEYDMLLRQSAMGVIWGLYPYVEDGGRKVDEVLIPILGDVHEDYVLRIYAFEMLLYHLGPEFYSHMLLMMEKEKNQKLTSYIYSSLLTFANSTDPCHQDMTEHARQALQFLEHYDRDIIKDSTNKFYAVYNAKYNYGPSVQLIKIPSNDSIFPRELYMRRSVNLFGKVLDVFEMGYNAEGKSIIDVVLEREFGPRGLRDWNHEITNKNLKKIIEKLHLKDTVKTEIKDYEFYMKMFNLDIYQTRNLFEDIRERLTGSSEISHEDNKAILNIHSIGYTDAEYVIPNELGLPVSMKFQFPSAFHLAGTSRVNMKSDETSHSLRSVNADMNMRATIDFSVLSSMMVKTKDFGKYGCALYTNGGVNLPIKGSFDVDLVTKKTSIKYIPSTEPYDIVYYNSQPYTVGESWIPIHYSSHPINKQYHAGHDFFGVGLTWNFTYDYYWNDFGTFRNFLKSFIHKPRAYEDYIYMYDKLYAGVRNFMDYTLFNPTAKPFHVNVRFEPSSNSPTTEFSLVSRREYSKHYDSDHGQEVFKYFADLTGKGNAERKWQLEFHSSESWPEKDMRKIVLNYKRSPLPSYDPKGYEVCYSRTASYTDWAKVYTMFPPDLKLNYNGQIKMGTTCDDVNAKEITIKGVGEKSEEQLSVDRSTLLTYKECEESKKDGYEMSDSCWKVIKDNGRMDKFTFDIDFKNVPEKMKRYFNKIYACFRHMFYNNLEILPMEGSDQENHVKVTANFSYNHPVVDVTIVRPHETDKYNHVFVPSILPQWEPFTVAESALDRITKRIFSYRRPICTISSKYIRTFDRVSYKADLGDCYYLAFSDAQDHHVHVLYRAVKDNSKYSKAIKVLFDNNEIEILPEGDHLKVKVNGKEEMQGKAAYIHHNENVMDFVVFKVYGSRYMIGSAHYGVYIIFDGEKSYIKASNFYRGKQRGLCGNFDGERVDEFEGTDGKIYHKVPEFVKSYGVQVDGCSLQ